MRRRNETDALRFKYITLSMCLAHDVLHWEMFGLQRNDWIQIGIPGGGVAEDARSHRFGG